MKTAVRTVAEPKQVRAPARTSRPVTSGSPATLAPFCEATALKAGEVTLVSLEAITEKLGAEWQARRGEAYDRAVRTLTKRIADGGAFLRISETDFLIVQPGLGVADAEDAALRFLTEILSLFIPEPDSSDFRLFRVAGVSDREVTAAPRDPDKIRRAAESARRKNSVDEAATDLLADHRWAPFVASNGRRVRPSCVLEPVFELVANTRIGYRLRRRVIDMDSGLALTPMQVSSLARADIVRIDIATIARGMERVRSNRDGGVELSLIIPVSYLSLTSPDGAAMISLALSKAREAVRAGIICEIRDIDGVSPAALSAAVAVVRPWSLLVVGHLTDQAPRASAALKEAGILVTSVNCPQNIDGDAQFLGWLKAAMRSSKKIGRSTIVYGCSTPRRLAMAGLAGASHAGLAAPGDPVPA